MSAFSNKHNFPKLYQLWGLSMSVLLGASLAVSAQADPDRKQRGDKKERSHGKQSGERLIKLDLNGDSLISFDEFSHLERLTNLDEAQKRKIFYFLDKSGDGNLQASELKPPESGVRERLSKRFDAIDTDKSGDLSEAELNNALTAKGHPQHAVDHMFGRLDRNSDGVLDRNELKLNGGSKIAEKMDFTKYDLDKSGGLNIEEYMKLPGVNKMPSERAQFIFERSDINADGEISQEEIRSPQRHRKPHGHKGFRSRDHGQDKPMEVE